jgi:acyl carrier protein
LYNFAVAIRQRFYNTLRLIDKNRNTRFMEVSEIISKTNAFLVEEFEVEPYKISPEANLKETLELDSLDYIDLVVVIESNLGFKVKPEDFQSIITFQDFYDYVVARVSEKEAV